MLQSYLSLDVYNLVKQNVSSIDREPSDKKTIFVQIS